MIAIAIKGAAATNDRATAPKDQEKFPFSNGLATRRLRDTVAAVGTGRVLGAVLDRDRATERAGLGCNQLRYEFVVQAVIRFGERVGESIGGIDDRIDGIGSCQRESTSLHRRAAMVL
jgi:hypothetical protein